MLFWPSEKQTRNFELENVKLIAVKKLVTSEFFAELVFLFGISHGSNGNFFKSLFLKYSQSSESYDTLMAKYFIDLLAWKEYLSLLQQLFSTIHSSVELDHLKLLSWERVIRNARFFHYAREIVQR